MNIDDLAEYVRYSKIRECGWWMEGGPEAWNIGIDD